MTCMTGCCNLRKVGLLAERTQSAAVRHRARRLKRTRALQMGGDPKTNGGLTALKYP
jgi:hypothetical protein